MDEPDEAPDLLPDEVLALQRAGALLVDVREADEWDAGRIPGSFHLPLSELSDRWQELPDADDTVFVCRSGGRSRAAADAFTAAGRGGCAREPYADRLPPRGPIGSRLSAGSI